MTPPSSKSIARCGAVLLATVVDTAHGFGVAAPALTATRPFASVRPSTSLRAIRCEDKTYQLEEREDKDVFTTELYLYPDRTIWFGSTDGAPYDEAVGRWDVPEGTNDFRMRIVRKFGTGTEGTDMGEFSYEIERFYTGEMTKVGDSVGITGIMQANSENAPGEFAEVGYFNMIDGTDERFSYEEKAQKLTSN